MKLKHFWLIAFCALAGAGLMSTCDKKPVASADIIDEVEADLGAAGACYEPAVGAGGMCE
jgi:hypothetical protein